MSKRRVGQATGKRPARRNGASRHRRPPAVTWPQARCEPMRDGWHFILPVPERTNVMWRNFRGRTVMSAKHRNDKGQAVRFDCTPLLGDVAVRIVWVRARKAGDVDGRVKACLDLLEGVAYENDAQVAELHVLRVDDPDQPARVEVFVWPADVERLAVTPPHDPPDWPDAA